TRADGTTTTWAYQLCTEPGADCPAPIAGAVSVMLAIEQSYAANAAVSSPQSRTYLDALGRTLRVQTQGFDGAGGVGAAPTLVSDTEYNPRGQVARQSNRYVLGGTPVWTSFSYDVLGRLTRQEQPDPDAPGGVAVTSTSYFALSFTVTNSKSQTKTTTKNTQGLILQVVDHKGSSIVYSYDALGQLIQTNAAGSITSMAYNQRGQKTAMLDPVMGAWDYRYNAFGELVSQTDSGGHTVTLAYDQLGRMTKRTEADLVSDWSYDKKFDGSACGKGVGKLCEAKAANGYVRKHTYDSLGRASVMSTVLDNPAVPAVVSETYDLNTGRVASKTWPSGYQAFYQFSALGYLKKVTAGGTAGFAQTVSYEVLAMNPQGQVTQYRQGNQVTTLRTFNTTSNRLTSQSATKDGQAAGNVLNHSYTYDSLDNLTSRVDANLGTQESFSYDS
ncbi:MAG: type IV secretion protein Rhs, partial [Rhodoferax sp.]|nr:type IV secretion protein Rhs [Rhodoferax sp.]